MSAQQANGHADKGRRRRQLLRGGAAWGGRPLSINYACHALCILKHASKLANKPCVFFRAFMALSQPTNPTHPPNAYTCCPPPSLWCCPTLPIQRISLPSSPCRFCIPHAGHGSPLINLAQSAPGTCIGQSCRITPHKTAEAIIQTRERLPGSTDRDSFHAGDACSFTNPY